MMPDFSLQDWITHWKIEFGWEAIQIDPETGDKLWIEIDDALDYQLSMLKADINNTKDKKKRDKLISTLHMTVGKSGGQVRGGSLTYWRLEIEEHFQVSKDDWIAMSLKERAMYIAKIQVSNTVATYQRLLNSS